MKILRYPHPLLKYTAHPLKRVDRTIIRFAADMMDLVKENRGIGLAATQVGLPFRLIVINLEGCELALVNPVISCYGSNKEMAEGCLSMPGVVAKVRRPSKCWVKAWSLHGDDVDEEVDGDMARVLQHEIDHLDGTVFTDRLSEWKRQAPPVGPALGLLQQFWAQKPHLGLDHNFRKICDDYCNVDCGLADY